MGRGASAVADLVTDPSFWRGKRVAITGHSGFKGAWLSLWLTALGAEVVGFSGAGPSKPSLATLVGLEDIVAGMRGDVRDAEAVRAFVAAQRPEIVLHLAAQPIVRRGFDDPVGTYATNVMGTVHVLDAVRRTDSVRVVVNVTSDKCYENREWEWAYREDEPMGGHDPYSSSKGCSELVTAAFRRSYSSAEGVRVASARAGNVVGGGDWGQDRLIPDVMRAAEAGAPIEIRSPHAVRPWQHVLNPLSGYLLLAERLWDDPELAIAFNFGPNEHDVRAVSVVVDMIAALWPEPLDRRVNPGPHPHEAGRLKLDSSRAAARLGWNPHWGLEATMEAVVAWHLAHRERQDMRAFTLGQIDAFAALSAAAVGR